MATTATAPTTGATWPDGTPRSQGNAFDWRARVAMGIDSIFAQDIKLCTAAYNKWKYERTEHPDGAIARQTWPEYRDGLGRKVSKMNYADRGQRARALGAGFGQNAGTIAGDLSPRRSGITIKPNQANNAAIKAAIKAATARAQAAQQQAAGPVLHPVDGQPGHTGAYSRATPSHPHTGHPAHTHGLPSHVMRPSAVHAKAAKAAKAKKLTKTA